MYKTLFIIMDNVCKACNPTILNLSIVKKKISLVLLDYSPKILMLTVLEFVICVCNFLLPM